MNRSIILTLRFRLKDKHRAELCRQARAVNYVWNFCNATQQKAAQAKRSWLDSGVLQRLTAGSSKLLRIHSQTICKVCQRYDASRREQRRAWLRFRGRKSLGWVPFHGDTIRIVGPGVIKFRGREFETMHWRDLPENAAPKSGSFSQDSRGRWYINIPVEMPPPNHSPADTIGMDLGLREIAALSTGEKIENHRHYRRLEARLGSAQRANKRGLARRIHSQIRNARKDQLHKVSADIAARHNIIVVGNVSPSRLAQTRMAKSVLDAGWADFKYMLRYKAMRHNGVMIEVDESYTSRDCSVCHARSGPQGLKALGVREWKCSECGTVHDRDVNAARNILRIGLDTLAEGAATCGAANLTHPHNQGRAALEASE